MSEIIRRGEEAWSENKIFLKKIRKNPPRNLDTVVADFHDKEFQKTACLDCANCCKTTGPLFTQRDIERIARHLKIKPGAFIDQYLTVDEEGDLVLQTVPCTFLGHDNYCSIYSVRPKACAEYPHTNRKKFHQLEEITLNNTKVCPAVLNILDELKKFY